MSPVATSVSRVNASTASSSFPSSFSSFLASPAALPAAPSAVSTQWLCDHLGSDTMVVLDASATRQNFDRLHIATALYADLAGGFSDPSGAEPYARPSATRFGTARDGLGITPETTVVVYDTASGQEATRLWWLFRSFGFERVSVLTGGFAKWAAEERPVG